MACSLDRCVFKKSLDRSHNFIQLVEQYDPARDASTEDGIHLHAPRVQLPEDPASRKRLLVNLYTGTSLFSALNQCLLHDDEAKMRQLAGYIKELRDVFRADADPQVAIPFNGRVYRGITVSNPTAVLQTFQVGEEFVWASFTSTSVSRPFGGNIRFEIQCTLPVDGQQARYVPAQVTHLSQFVAEDEVLIPPHVRFRVVEIKGSVIQLDAVEYPPVWSAPDSKGRIETRCSQATGRVDVGRRPGASMVDACGQ